MRQNEAGNAHQVNDSVDSVVRRQHHGFRVSLFLLELEDCRVDFIRVLAKNDDVPALLQ